MNKNKININDNNINEEIEKDERKKSWDEEINNNIGK